MRRGRLGGRAALALALAWVAAAAVAPRQGLRFLRPAAAATSASQAGAEGEVRPGACC